jgi:shikimate 5-dehydrogenase
MLIYQGALAFELWTGAPAPVDVMFEAARRRLAAERPA